MPNSSLNQSKGITSPGLQHVTVEEKAESGGVAQRIQEPSVGPLAVTLAAEVDTLPLRDALDHPIRGTAPYTPPRYF